MKEFSSYINQEAMRLSRLVSDLLDLSSVEPGRMSIHPEILDLNAIVQEVVGNHRRSAPRHVVMLELDSELPAVPGDRDRLAQAVLNLLSNAIKYSPEGGEVRVGTSHDAMQLLFWVCDDGIGIPQEDLERIFERYRRMATGAHPAIKGIGLGLPIVRHIAELHGGRAWADSELGQGSTSYLTLPLPVEVQAT